MDTLKRGQKDVGHEGSAPLPPAAQSAPLSSVGSSVTGTICYRHHGIVVPHPHVTRLLTLEFIIKHPLQILN